MELVSAQEIYELKDRIDVEIWTVGNPEPFRILLNPETDSLVDRGPALFVIERNEDQSIAPAETMFPKPHITRMSTRPMKLSVAVLTPGPLPTDEK